VKIVTLTAYIYITPPFAGRYYLEMIILYSCPYTCDLPIMPVYILYELRKCSSAEWAKISISLIERDNVTYLPQVCVYNIYKINNLISCVLLFIGGFLPGQPAAATTGEHHGGVWYAYFHDSDENRARTIVRPVQSFTYSDYYLYDTWI